MPVAGLPLNPQARACNNRNWNFLEHSAISILREHAGDGGRRAETEGEADTSLSRELDMGLDPTTLGSWPEQRQTLN